MNKLPLYDKHPETLKELKERVLEILRQGWTKAENARNVNQQPVSTFSPDATCCCLWGALCRAYGEGFSMPPLVALFCESFRKTFDTPIQRFVCGLVLYNDTHTKEEVIAKVESISVEDTDASNI